jgi:hypothetical protein
MELLGKSQAMYFDPESIGSADGARCNICWKFDPFDFSCIEVMGSIDGKAGVCGLYVNGEPQGQKHDLTGPRKVSKTEAGYTEKGPTHCGNCHEMIPRAVYGLGRCKKVEGMVDGRACCNQWEPM